MPEIIFEDEAKFKPYRSPGGYGQETQTPVLVNLLARAGLPQRQAYYVLIGISVILTFIIFVILRSNFSASKVTASDGKPLYIEDIPLIVRQNIPPEVLKQVPSYNDR